MGTTAKLYGEIPHLHNAYFLTIFLTKQCHGSGFLCLIQAHLLGNNRKRCLNLFIDQILYLL